MKYYLAYGMNTNIEEMKARCPLAKNLGIVTLANHELKFRYHADIDNVDGKNMQALLWSITEDCERSLDNLEGYPYYYVKGDFVVETPHLGKNMTHCIAMAYIMRNKGALEEPSPRYLECVLQGYIDNGFDLALLETAVLESRQ